MKAARYTTREVAELLVCLRSEALQLLRAASVPAARCGSALLWDSAAVDRLISTLRPHEAGVPSHRSGSREEQS